MSEKKNGKNTGAGTLNEAADMLKGNRIIGIVAAVAMILFGMLFVAIPLEMAYLTEIFAMCGFVVYGVFRIAAYIRTPAESRVGWTLANGIIAVVLGFLIVFAPPGVVIETFAFILGFLAVSSGINQIAMSGAIKRETGANPAWIIISGIINLIVGIFLVISPLAFTAALEFVFGIYLIVGGIALIIEVIGQKSRRA
jgi:uncharacterized membrane protein HdeD (DUF308 family)